VTRQRRTRDPILTGSTGEDRQRDMVLRTVFLPVELDQTLKEDASKHGVRKGDLIRKALGTRQTFARGARTTAPPVEDDRSEDMILRTVFLPVDLDVKLQEDASKRGITRSDLIRKALWKYYRITPTP
jgi:hypothetical protein